MTSLNTDHRIEWYAAEDGRRLAVHVWKAEGPPRARVVFVHGISSHAGWYTRGNEYLAAAGFEVHFLDRRGSGMNTEDRGDVDHWHTWVDDVAIYLQQLRSASGSIVLGGISWGGKLASAVARRHAALIDGLALICPGLYSPFEPGILKRLALRSPLTRLLRGRRIEIPLVDPKLFTDTPSWQAFIAQDPLTLRDITLGFAREDRALTRYARRAAPYLAMPTLLMLAGLDRIIDNARVRRFYERVASPEMSLVEFPDAAHTLEFEPDPRPHFRGLTEWIGGVARRNL